MQTTQNSKLNSIVPSIDENQVLHESGRLKNNNCTNLILVPKNGTVTELIIRLAH